MLYRNSLKGEYNPGNNALVLIGPEGDFSLKERDLLNSMSNCIPISLGQNILRSETAAVVGLTILNYQIN